ncbi:MAG: glycosyltransferase [Desulfovibrio sp.]|nr:glycosyltransferase [Desulfovibrio sp.]
MLDTPLRVLLVLPMYGGSLPIGRYCATALESLGMQVRVFEAPIFHSTFTQLRTLDLAPEHITSLEHSFLNVVSQAIFNHVQDFEPHLVLAMAQAPLPKNILSRLKRLGIRTVMWFVEDYTVFSYWRSYAPLYDAFAIIQKEPFIEELKSINQPNVLYLPLAALPSFHKRVPLTPKEQRYYGASIGFLGAGYPNRRLAFRPLAGKDFKIWGTEWEEEPLLANNIQEGGKRINSEESLKIYSATTINLNLHSSLRRDTLVSHGDFVNPRTFELASIGAFQLVDKRTLLPELFDDQCIATFSTMEECYQKIDYYLHHKEEREAFCAKAQARVLKEHTYQKRMETLIQWIDAHLGWPRFANDIAPKTQLDATLQQALDQLLAKLGASPNASFSDVIGRLRKQSGALDPLEASLLFLDEWQKQYGTKR